MRIRRLWNWRVLWLVLLGTTLSVPARAADGSQHGHEAGAHALRPDKGQRWKTSGPVRRSMDAIRSAMAAEKEAIGANTHTAARYKALAGKLDEQVARIVSS